LANNVEIYDDSESISVSDIAVYSLDINDILAGGTISISSAVSILEGGTITTNPTTKNITPPADTNVQVSVTVDSANTISITVPGANEISISDVASIGPQGPVGAQGPAGVSSIDPFVVVGDNVGLNIADPQFELHISGTLFSPLVTSSKMDIKGTGDGLDLFIVKAYDSDDTKFVINLQGVTILGQFHTTPDVVDGGMFYSASGDFYLGS
tara:strand:+ start:1458 stop:2090 length:633 start_codon:yes stop_codon:yes gene_type:complete